MICVVFYRSEHNAAATATAASAATGTAATAATATAARKASKGR